MDRVDSLIAELQSRHRNDDARFLREVRPLVVSVLDPAIPAHARTGLLELLAETFERDAQIRRDSERSRAAVRRYLDALRRWLRG
jgi:hypothetical protein